MTKITSYKVGDKIIEFDQIFQIFKIEYQKNGDGEKEPVMFFKTYFEEGILNPVVCSIPIKNLSLTDIRKPISKKELKIILNKLNSGRILIKFINVDQIKDMLKTRNLYDVVNVIKILSKEEKDNPEKFNRNKKVLFESAVKILAQEYALVNRTEMKNAREKIMKLV
ncbi:MAG TPA: hypothetical protein VI819_05590 [Patescibacteria group bacterium]|nr:hypothetical protein [Patescibacteria group bacterium]